MILDFYKPMIRVARAFFAVQPTSAASEAAFSAAGFLRSDLRKSMAPCTLNSLCVLKCNIHAGEGSRKFAKAFVEISGCCAPNPEADLHYASKRVLDAITEEALLD